MASGIISTRPQEEGASLQGRYGDFIQKRLEHTRRQVRLVDVGSGIVLLLAASLFFFFAVAVADHWLFPHGLNFFARFLLWTIGVAVAGYFAWRYLAPAVLRRINPVFAAHAIEQGRPKLKNSLINFLLLRSHPDDVVPVVYQAMERRAATDLSLVPVEHAVDHRRLIHLCYVLAAAVVLFAAYLLFSPKNPLVSAARVIWPWAGIPAPTRVHIENVQPGNAAVFQGNPQAIEARVSGLRSGEEVWLLMSTADGQVVDDRIPMTRSGEDDRYTCDLPPGTGAQSGGGLQQDTIYRITAGDATTPTYRLEVQIAPTILVDQIVYHFPAYTGFADRVIKGQGDIQALEGARVTVHATANLPIKEAKIDLGCGGLRCIPMKPNEKQASGEFTLTVEPGKTWTPPYERYQIQFTDTAENSKKSQHPIQHRIEVERDYPPEVQVVEPKQENVDVAIGSHVRIRVHAVDPDFALRRVSLHAEHNGQALELPVLLDRVPPEKGLAKPFDADFDFRPEAFGLKKGDEIKYWAEAFDNKEPQPNRSETPRRTIRVVDEHEAQPGQQDQPQQGVQKPSNDKRPEQGGNDRGGGEQAPAGSGDKSRDESPKPEPSDQQKNSEGSSDKSQKPDQGKENDPSKSENGTGGKDGASSDAKNGSKGAQGSAEADNQSKRPRDPTTETADATKEILKHMEEQQQKEKEKEQQQNQPQQSGESGGQNGPQQESKPQQGDNRDASQPTSSPQGGQDNKQPQGGQDDKQPQNASADKNQQGGSSGGPQSQENKSGSMPNNSTGSQPDNRNKGTGSQGNDKRPQQGQDSGDSQPQGGQGNDQNKQATGPQNSGGNSGANKPESKQHGGDKPQENQNGGSKSPEQKPSGNPQGKEGPSGGNPQNAERKPSGGSEKDQQQIARAGGKPDDKNKNPSTSQGDPNMPHGQEGNPEKTPKPDAGNQGNTGGQDAQTKSPKKEEGGGTSSGSPQQPKPGQDPQQGTGGGEKQSDNGTKKQDQPNMGNGEPRQAAPGKTGEPTKQESDGAPDSQVERNRAEQKAGDAREGLSQKPEKSQSPGNSPHDSKSNGESRGDKRGGGGAGGGQQDKKAGKGAAGTQMAANEGGSSSEDQGHGQTGDKPGESVASKDRTGSNRQELGKGNGEKTEPSQQPTANENPNAQNNVANNASNNPQKTDGGQSGAQSSQHDGHQGTGLPTGGNLANGQAAPPPADRAAQEKADEADLESANKQVDMALRHLKDEMAKPKPDLLDRLGWTQEEAKKFVDNVEKLRDGANRAGNEGQANQKAYNEFLKDIGLRPHGTRIQGGATKTDDLRGVRDAGQIEAPAEWADLTRKYSRETAERK